MNLQIWWIYILVVTVSHTRSQEIDTKDFPIDLLNLKHIKIDNYTGPLRDSHVEIFKNIESLQLSQSTLTPFALNILNPLVNLKRLSLSNCQIPTKEEANITNCCKNLREIELINNNISVAVDWGKIGKWPIEKFYAFRQKMLLFPGQKFSTATLKDLTFEYCEIETIEDDSSSHLGNLEHLNLQENKIKSISRNWLDNMKNLKTLNLKGNLIEKFTTDMFPSMPNLEKINVGHNPIKEFNLVGMLKLVPKLKEVDVSGIDEIDLSKSGDVTLVKSEVL